MKLVLPQLRDSSKRNRQTAILGPWLIFLGIASAIAIIFSVVSTQGAGVSSGFTKNLFYCDNNNKIRYKYSDDSFEDRSPYWDGNLFLSVTMGFHGLSFSEAKAIDILFDLVCGRGSQILVSLLAYPILRRAILRSMEIRDFSLALLVPFLLERISANTLWAMLANMRVRRKVSGSEEQTPRSKIRIDWRTVLTILIGSYILALPTFLSAMTSYQALGAPFIATDDAGSSYMSTENLTIPDFIITDGSEVGLSRWFPLYNKTSDPQLFAAFIGYQDGYDKASDLWRHNWPLSLNLNTTKYSNVGEAYLESELAFNHTRDSLPQRQNVTDPNDPPLWSFTLWPHNATWDFQGRYRYIIRSSSYLTSSIVVMNTTYEIAVPIYLDENLSYGVPSASTFFEYADNKTASGSELASIGKCLPSEDYIWGFSSLMLFTFCMITLVVLLLMMTLHYDAYFNSMADRYKLETSPYRDVLDLAGELRSQYGEDEAEAMTATALDKAMQTNPATAGLETETLHRSRAAKWKQDKQYPRLPTWNELRRKSTVAGSSNTDAEQSLIAIGLDAQGSELEMAKMPAKVFSRRDS